MNAQVLNKLLLESGYDTEEREFLVDGFTNGFDLGYRGPMIRKDLSNNLPFRVGDEYDLWEKMMAEVECK